MPWAGSLTELRGEIEQDQTSLRDLLQRLGEAESATKKTLGWLSEKLGVARRTLSPGYEPELAMLEDLEALALGIQGKLGLWRALAIVAPAPPALRGLDLVHLQQRARSHTNVWRRCASTWQKWFSGERPPAWPRPERRWPRPKSAERFSGSASTAGRPLPRCHRKHG